MRAARAWRILRFLITAGALFSLWLVFTFSLEAFSLATGLAGSLLVAALTHGVFIAEHEAYLGSFLPRPLRLIGFLGYLVLVMYVSSAQVLWAMLRGRAEPRVLHFRTRLKSDLARAFLANAITFTPGTITLDLNDDHLTVHWFLATTRHSGAAGERVKGGLEARLGKVLS